MRQYIFSIAECFHCLWKLKHSQENKDSLEAFPVFYLESQETLKSAHFKNVKNSKC